MRFYFLLLLYITYAASLVAQPFGEDGIHQPKYEVRAAWVTAVYGLDWPRSRAVTPEGIRKQKAELVEILDRLKAAHFNTVLFQTRTRGDVLYRSKIEPFNSILTGKAGMEPGYDPLAFAIEECHKRGMECHAWMVGIRHPEESRHLCALQAGVFPQSRPSANQGVPDEPRARSGGQL